MTLDDALDRLRNLPGVYVARRVRHQWRVEHGAGWKFSGYFPTRAAAISWSSTHSGLPVGDETPGVAERYWPVYEQMHLFDYPAMYWICRLLGDAAGQRLVDLGGHFGAKFRVYAARAGLPPGLTWTVCETELVSATARKVHLPETPPGLEFTSGPECIDGADVLFASGVLQYLDQSLPEILAALGHLPRGIVLNKVPLAEVPEHWTLECNGLAVALYHVMNRGEFLRGMEELGYSVLDSWDMPYGIEIPFRVDAGTKRNSGLAFALEK